MVQQYPTIRRYAKPITMPIPMYCLHTDVTNILVVDDEIPIATMVADVLTDEGYTVEVYHDGASALQAIRDHPPCLLLLDLAMPIMGGEELLRLLRQMGYTTLPIILMSADPRLPGYIDQGATAVIPKPFELTKLLDCVSESITNSEREA